MASGGSIGERHERKRAAFAVIVGAQQFDKFSLPLITKGMAKDKIELLPLSQFVYAAKNNFINADTLYFNNLVKNKEELLEKWIIPVKESWLAKKLENTAMAAK